MVAHGHQEYTGINQPKLFSAFEQVNL